MSCIQVASRLCHFGLANGQFGKLQTRPNSRTRMQPEDETEITPPPESAITTKTYELPVGTTVSVRSEETIDSAKTIEGQTFAGQVTEDVRDASSRYQKVTDSGEPPTSCLALQKLAIDGREYEIRVIIGAIVGGGKGAAIGAGAGGGGGHWAKF